MGIDCRIEKISEYFLSYNIAEGVAYALVKFPPKWTVPQEIDTLKVKTAKDDNTKGVYFFCEVKDGYDKVFDAIEYVIELNKNIAEKTELLVKKANELKELFASQPIEKLRTLEFVFPPQKKNSKKKPKKETKLATSEDIIVDNPVSLKEEPITVNNEVVEECVG